MCFGSKLGFKIKKKKKKTFNPHFQERLGRMTWLYFFKKKEPTLDHALADPRVGPSKWVRL